MSSKFCCFLKQKLLLANSHLQLPLRDYNIDCSEVEILCPYSNSRVPGDMCLLRYPPKQDATVPKKAPHQESALELQSRAAPSVKAHHCVNSLDTGKNSGERRMVKKKLWAELKCLHILHPSQFT